MTTAAKGELKRLYIMEMGETRYETVATTAGGAFRNMVKRCHLTPKDFALLARFKSTRLQGTKWTRWLYQDPHALRREP